MFWGGSVELRKPRCNKTVLGSGSGMGRLNQARVRDIWGGGEGEKEKSGGIG